MDNSSKHHVVIIGGGFGGLRAAQNLGKAPVRVTLIDKNNYHLFQPLLYQVATGGLSPADIASPLRAVLKKQKNTAVLMGEVIDIDPDQKRVILTDGEVKYDTLIVATGSIHHYFGNENWPQYAPGLKTIEDATDIRRRILLAFEVAERETDKAKISTWLNFIVIGGGPTGVELAGAVAEISRDTLRRDFRNINPAGAKIVLLEGADRILPQYPPDLSDKAEKSLEKMGVEVRTGAMVTEMNRESVVFQSGDEEKVINTRTVLWAAGVKSSSLADKISHRTGTEQDKSGRLQVQPDLSLKKYPDIFIIGDMALAVDADGRPLPGVAQVAMQQGIYVAGLIKNRLKGKNTKQFRYRDYGSMATIGRSRAVADLKKIRLSGWLGWLAWLFVHLMYIVEFENRLLVLIQWAWNYFTRNRSARLITGQNPFPLKSK